MAFRRTEETVSERDMLCNSTPELGCRPDAKTVLYVLCDWLAYVWVCAGQAKLTWDSQGNCNAQEVLNEFYTVLKRELHVFERRHSGNLWFCDFACCTVIDCVIVEFCKSSVVTDVISQ